MTGLREIAAVHDGELRLTPNQNLVISRIPDGRRARIESLIKAHSIDRDARPERAAAQLYGLRGPADLRARDGRERALPS